MTVRSLTYVALAAAFALAPLAPAALAADNAVKVVKPVRELQLKGNATAPDVHCSTVPSQTLQPCTQDFKAWCKVVGGTYGETANPDVEACFHRNEW